MGLNEPYNGKGALKDDEEWVEESGLWDRIKRGFRSGHQKLRRKKLGGIAAVAQKKINTDVIKDENNWDHLKPPPTVNWWDKPKEMPKPPSWSDSLKSMFGMGSKPEPQQQAAAPQPEAPPPPAQTVMPTPPKLTRPAPPIPPKRVITPPPQMPIQSDEDTDYSPPKGFFRRMYDKLPSMAKISVPIFSREQREYQGAPARPSNYVPPQGKETTKNRIKRERSLAEEMARQSQEL